jgi:hypothetical protein
MWQQYNREELYQKVWEQPMLRVAEQYGVSSVALGKVCRKLSIPVPGRGHWAKLAYGQPGATKPELPNLMSLLDRLLVCCEAEAGRTSMESCFLANPAG